MKLAVQLYTLRDDYSNGDEFLELLGKVKEIGFDGVEFAGFAGLEPEVIKKRLDELGLEAVGAHCSTDDFCTPEKAAEAVRLAKALGMETIGTGGAAHSTKEDIRRLNEIYKIANEVGEKEGVKFYYHNHHEEFELDFDGRLCEDCIADEAYLQIDTYWSFYAGADNYKYITEHKDRIVHLHIKDGNGGHPCALGEGENDLPSVFKAAKECGIEWLILEDDEPKPNGIDDITRSMEYFKKNL